MTAGFHSKCSTEVEATSVIKWSKIKAANKSSDHCSSAKYLARMECVCDSHSFFLSFFDNNTTLRS